MRRSPKRGRGAVDGRTFLFLFASLSSLFLAFLSLPAVPAVSRCPYFFVVEQLFSHIFSHRKASPVFRVFLAFPVPLFLESTLTEKR
jgi:hypothetical protein